MRHPSSLPATSIAHKRSNCSRLCVVRQYGATWCYSARTPRKTRGMGALTRQQSVPQGPGDSE
eukprot:8115313-Lingulodinium_polyedra.AAC.1